MPDYSDYVSNDSNSQSTRSRHDDPRMGRSVSIDFLVGLVRDKSAQACEARLREQGLSFERLVSLVCR